MTKPTQEKKFERKSKEVNPELRQNWRNRMNSVHNRMSRGAEHIWRIIKSRVNFGQKGSGNTYNKKKLKSLNRPK